MRIEMIAKAFVNKQNVPQSANTDAVRVSSTGRKLFSYKTCIAQWIKDAEHGIDVLVINKSEYTKVTQRLQANVHYEATQGTHPYICIEGIPFNTDDLQKYNK